MQHLHVAPEIEFASTPPASFYTSTDYFELSKEKIFARSWQFCAGRNELKNQGQLVPHTILPGVLDESILFVHENEEFHCLSNVCTHRGKILVESPCSNAKQILCGYHGRRFTLCGKFMHMPEFADAKNFPTEKENLPHVPFGQLGELIFASIFPFASFDAVFKDIKERLSWLPIENMRFDASRAHDYTVNAHWALYCENYLEGLHIPFVHKALRATLDFNAYKTELYRYCNLQLALAAPNESCFEIPADAQDAGKRVAAYYYWIFPNIMLNFYPWGCSVNIVQPITPSLTKVLFRPYILDASKLDQGAGGDLNRVEMEDEAVVESVQKGIRSRLYSTGRYSPSMEQGTHHFHQLLCEFLN